MMPGGRNGALRSVLAQASVDGGCFRSGGCELREVTAAAVLMLRSLQSAEELAQSIRTSGFELPVTVNGASGERPSVLCPAPGEWLFVSETGDAGELSRRIMRRVDTGRTFLLDCTDAYAMFRLRGAAAPWLLSKLGALDFRAGVGSGQHCARTLLSQAPAIVHWHAPQTGAGCFDLLFDRSIAQYMWALLRASAAHADDLERCFGGSPGRRR